MVKSSASSVHAAPPPSPPPPSPFNICYAAGLTHTTLSVSLLVKSLSSPFFLPPIGAEPGRAKLSWTLFSPARVQPLQGAGRKESSGTGLSPFLRTSLWCSLCPYTRFNGFSLEQCFSSALQRLKLCVDNSTLFPCSTKKRTQSSFLPPLTDRWNMYEKVLQNQLPAPLQAALWNWNCSA